MGAGRSNPEVVGSNPTEVQFSLTRGDSQISFKGVIPKGDLVYQQYCLIPAPKQTLKIIISYFPGATRFPYYISPGNRSDALPLGRWTNPAIQPNWKDLYVASSEKNRTFSAVRIASLCSSWSAIRSKFSHQEWINCASLSGEITITNNLIYPRITNLFPAEGDSQWFLTNIN